MITGSAPETGCFEDDKALRMQHLGDGYWELAIGMEGTGMLEYRYLVFQNDSIKRREWGENHRVRLPSDTTLCTLYDFWQPQPERTFLYSSAYACNLLAIEGRNHETGYAPGCVTIKVHAPFVKKGQNVAITGSCPTFGEWKEHAGLKMQPEQFPEWSITLHAEKLPESCTYKFVINDITTGKTVCQEWGEPRNLFVPRSMDRQMLLYSGMLFRYQEAPLKGAGVTIPVFSLRSENSWGCGDFGDLRKMTDWARLCGMQMIQILPVNDTTLTDTWMDTYPYKPVSVFALHPIYISICDLPALKDKKEMQQYEKKRLALNDLPEVKYEKVLRLKWSYMTKLFQEQGQSVLQSKDYQDFYHKNQDWLIPYAAFHYLRENTGNHDFHNWGEYATYDRHQIEKLISPDKTWHQDIAIHYFVQYLLHRQLSKVKDYTREQSVILKGDIPIGISPYGVEAWSTPHLFNMDSQIGAPPDSFSSKGQNWEFPTYNWEQMKKEDFCWWKRRFKNMSDYFDACRIDHILGFFRIWDIPSHSVEGLLGHFSPALPLSLDDLKEKGFRFNKKKMIEPYITEDLIDRLFGKEAETVKASYLRKSKSGRYQLLAAFNTQQKIRRHLNGKDSRLEKRLFALCNEVLFLRDSHQPDLFHPRILGAATECYKALSQKQRSAFNQLYKDFFYARNVELWKDKAYELLLPLTTTTRMLICGEDLGMIPTCVPEVMQQLGILSLEIQRMPKRSWSKFENLNTIPYQSVCTTSTHDMSPIRAWWQESREDTQQYYQQILWKQGKAPEKCSPEIAEQIISQHLASPALWVTLPWQDWMAMDGKLRREDPEAERINVPDDPAHNWNYRMHLTLEQLLREEPLSHTILSLVKNAGRI
jgi:4-alpha-glucanotransferase